MMHSLKRRFDGNVYEFYGSANNVTKLAALKKDAKKWYSYARVVRSQDAREDKYRVYVRGYHAEYRVRERVGKRWKVVRGSPKFISIAAATLHIEKLEKANKRAGVKKHYGWVSSPR